MKRIAFYSIIIALSVFTFPGCMSDLISIEGNGNIVSRTLDLEPFTAIDMLGVEDVEISYGPQQEVVVVGDENILQRIRTDVHQGTWNMCLEKGRYAHYNLKYYITVPQINGITNEGVSRVKVNDFINQGDLSISLEGTGEIELNRMENTENLYVHIDGLGKVTGNDSFPSLRNLEITITGSGHFNAFPVETDYCTVDIVGAGTCDITVHQRLDVSIDGAGVVHYRGTPDVYQEVSGLGIVKNN